MNTSCLLRRLGHGLLQMLGVVVLNFLPIRLAPGDPAVVIAGEMGGATQEMLDSIRADYGLDKPVLTQLWLYVSPGATGDLGESFFFNQPVAKLIAQRIGPTILLVLCAQFLSILPGVFFGVIAARKPGGVLSGFVSVFATFGYAAPVFWTGIMLIILFASVVPVFPVEGMQSVKLRDAGFVVKALDIAHHLILPAFTLAIIYLAQYARLSRASMLEALGSDYIRTARAKGASEKSVLFKRALRNAALPILTVAGLQFGTLISGALLVETVFNWPGMGRLAFDSILRRDYPTIMGALYYSGDPFDIVWAPHDPPGATPEFPLGTDYLGCNVVAGMLMGGGPTLALGAAAAAITMVTGISLGALAGYYDGWVDNLLMRVTEFFQVLSALLFAMVLVTLFSPSLFTIAMAIGVVSWPQTARLTRAEFLKIKELEYVTAARAIGARNQRIIWKVILPNAAPPLIVSATLTLGVAILFEAGLAFLGLGDPNVMSWGLMIGANREYIHDAWWPVTFPGLAVFFTVFAVSLIGDGLNGAFNPKLRER